MTMKTYWAWKHDINSTHTNMSGYTKILARDMKLCLRRKAQKHYKYHMFNSNFNVSVMSGETDKHGYAKECTIQHWSMDQKSLVSLQLLPQLGHQTCKNVSHNHCDK